MAASKKLKEKEKSAQLAESSVVANGNIGELLECPITNEPMAREGVDESVPMITLCCGKTCSKGAATKVNRCPFCRREPLETIENRLVEDIAKKYPEEKKAERARLHQITQQTKEKEKSLINSQKQELESLQNKLTLAEERFQKSSKNEKKQEKEIARKDNALAEIQNQLNTSQQENLKLVADLKDTRHQLTLSNQRQAELSATIAQQTRWWRNPWLMFAAGVGGALLYTWHKATQPEETLPQQPSNSLDLLEPVLKFALAQLGQRFLPTINEVAQNLWQEQQHVRPLESFPPIHPPIYEPNVDLLGVQSEDKKEEPVPVKEYQPASLLPERKNINTILQNLCSDSLDARNEAFKILHFDADVRNLITSQNLQMACDGVLYKGATIFHVVTATNAAILLEHKDLRDKITSEDLQTLATDGFCKGIPPLVYLMQDKTSILLKYKDLRDKITTKGLETFFAGGPLKGYSLFTFLLLSEDKIKLLEDKDLRDKITPKILQATIPDGPYQGAPVFLILVKEEKSMELLLKYKDLRDKITVQTLRKIAGEGTFEGASAIYWLLKSDIGRQVLLADNLRLFNFIDPTTFLTTYQFYNDDDKHKVGHWLDSFQEGRALLKKAVITTARAHHPTSANAKSGFFSTDNHRPSTTNNRPNVDDNQLVKH